MIEHEKLVDALFSRATSILMKVFFGRTEELTKFIREKVADENMLKLLLKKLGIDDVCSNCKSVSCLNGASVNFNNFQLGMDKDMQLSEIFFVNCWKLSEKRNISSQTYVMVGLVPYYIPVFFKGEFSSYAWNKVVKLSLSLSISHSLNLSLSLRHRDRADTIITFHPHPHTVMTSPVSIRVKRFFISLSQSDFISDSNLVSQ